MDQKELEEEYEALSRRHGVINSYGLDLSKREIMLKEDSIGIFSARIFQIVHDILGKESTGKRMIDLACYEGLLSLGLAMEGWDVVGVEGREDNFKKMEFAVKVLGLKNFHPIMDNVKSVTRENYGHFDVVLAAGILYHLEARSAFDFMENIFNMTDRVAIIDTHISLAMSEKYAHKGNEYWGKKYRETSRESNLAASIGNDYSFWFTKASLINLMKNTGFSSIYECVLPYVTADRALYDRVTFVAMKGEKVLPPFPTAPQPEFKPEQVLGRILVHPNNCCSG